MNGVGVNRYYPLFGLGANVALIFSGQYVRFVSSVRANLPDHVDKWGVSLKLLMSAVVALGTAVVGSYTYMQKKVGSTVPVGCKRKTGWRIS